MDCHVNVIFKGFDFGTLILIDDVFDRQVVNLEPFLKIAQLCFGRRIEMKPKIGIAMR